jgi:hypothetical protein
MLQYRLGRIQYVASVLGFRDHLILQVEHTVQINKSLTMRSQQIQ